MSQNVPAKPENLQVGDILLMLGQGPLSDLIAWASDGPYSHAALVADGGDLIEASAAGARRYPLSKRLVDEVNYHYIDAFRMPAPGGGALAQRDAADVLAKSVAMLGLPYPVDQLALLGVIMAVRGKWPAHPLARLVVREALDHAAADDDRRVVCSEMVYRAFAECAAVPARRLAPEIVVGERGDAPFPDVDWKALFEELWPLLRPGRQRALQPDIVRLNAVASADAPGLLAAGGSTTISDDELERARRAVLASVGAAPVPAGTRTAVPALDPPPTRPNPKLVSPQDLAASPSLVLQGRLLQRRSKG